MWFWIRLPFSFFVFWMSRGAGPVEALALAVATGPGAPVWMVDWAFRRLGWSS